MTRRHWLFAVAVIVMSGSTAVAQPAAPAAPPACPATTFADFARVFLSQPAVQQRFIRPTLAHSRVVDADPEPKTVSGTLSATEALKTYLDPVRNPTLGLMEMRIVAQPKPQVTLDKADSDQQFTLTFEETTCWVLTAIDDHSL